MKQLIIIFLLTAICFACEGNKKLIENPQHGDIYIFEENTIYYPVMVDSIDSEKIYCVNSKFKFTDAVPGLDDLPKSDFDFSFRLIYDRVEIERLYESGNIVEVYRL